MLPVCYDLCLGEATRFEHNLVIRLGQGEASICPRDISHCTILEMLHHQTP